jgi:hypothetical protein
MGGLYALRNLQGGFETVLGDGAASTVMLSGTGVLEDLTKVVKVPEHNGMGPGFGRTNISEVGGRLKLDGTASFEQLLYPFLCGIDGTVTGARDGSGPYVYTFPFMTTAAKTPKTRVLEGGDNQQEEEMFGCFLESFELKGGWNKDLSITEVWRGQQVNKGTFTTLLTPQTLHYLNTNMARLYIEAANGTIGATIKSDTLTDFTLKVDTGFQPIPTPGGVLYYTAIKQVPPSIKFDATCEYNASAVALVDNYRAQVGNLVRLKIEGPAAAVAGSTYTYLTLLVDMALKWMSVKALTQSNGDDQVQISGEAYMETACTPDLFANITLVNDLSAPV